MPTYTPNYFEALTKADAIIKFSGANIMHERVRAFFIPSKDIIYLPNKDRFFSAGEYYVTVMHELIHWTGHESRLNRNFDKKGKNVIFTAAAAASKTCDYLMNNLKTE